MPHAVTRYITQIVRFIMARRQLLRVHIGGNLRPRHREQGTQDHAVPFPHGGESRGSRPAQDAHENGLREIVRMMRRRNTVRALLRAGAM